MQQLSECVWCVCDVECNVKHNGMCAWHARCHVGRRVKYFAELVFLLELAACLVTLLSVVYITFNSRLI